jgi:outer membrane receptor protein involved in Fe transport
MRNHVSSPCTPRLRGRTWTLFIQGLVSVLAVMFTGITMAQDEGQEVEEVVVTGSYIKKSPADSPSPLSIISSADIENNHTVDMNELLLRIPYQQGGYIQAATFTGGGFQGRLPINLRNLGDAATLPLVNGRRHLPAFVAPLGDSTVDVNSMIPQVMIDRIEIVKDGSSALYGSDAVAGVVNFITKRDFEGVDLDVRYLTDERTRVGDEISVGLLVGAQGDRGGFVVGMDFLDRAELPTDEPEIYEFMGGFGVSGTGNPGRFPFADSSPLLFTDGTPVPLANNRLGGQTKLLPRVANPDPNNLAHWGNADFNCNDAAAWDGFGGTLGTTPSSAGYDNHICAIDYGNFFSIQEGEVLQKIYATGYFNLTDRVELFFEGGFAEQEFYRPNSLAPQARAPVIPTTNFGLIEDARRRGIQPVPLVNVVRLEGGTRELTGTGYRPIDSKQDGDRDTIRGVVGIDADFDIGDREWNLLASFTWSETSSFQNNVEDTTASNLIAALNGFGGPNCNQFSSSAVPGEGNLAYAQSGNFDDGNCYYYNPFGNAHFDENGNFVDGLANPSALYNPPELIQWMEGAWIENDEVEQRVVDIILSGELFDMPNGPAGFALGFQSRIDWLQKDFNQSFRSADLAFRFQAFNVEAASNQANAVFAEFQLPLLDTVDVQVAVRYEDFPDIGQSTTDPKISGIWRPNDSWSFRASWGTSYRVGGLMQLFGTQTIVSNTRDPFLDTEFFLPWISTGNEELEPETSEAWNIGLSWQGQDGWTEGLFVNLDYWNYDYKNLLTKESAPALLIADGNDRLGPDGIPFTADDGPGNPEQVIRNTTFNPVRILPKFINANSVKVSGADLELGYSWDNNLGFFDVGMQMAWWSKYEANTDGGTVDGVGSLNRTTILARALPEFKTNFTFNWARDRHSVYVLARYIDGVRNDGAYSSFIGQTRSLARCYIETGQVCTVDAALLAQYDDSYQEKLKGTWWTDFYYNFSFPKMGPVPEGSVISVGVRNVFDTEPETVNNNSGFDGIMHDARGRMWMLRYRVSLI